MSLYKRFQAMAARLLAKRGDDVTLTMRTKEPKRDGAKPWRGSTGTVTKVVKAVQFPYEVEEMPDATVRQGSSRFIIAENDLSGISQFDDVKLTDAIDLEESDGSVWSISSLEIIEPGAERILYLVNVDR